ncbi:MAG: hypothetical protein IJ305_04575 [Oscillospiraceae bacterium]|nr:hypothetical protein [Oscillospiraceae bacterium]
MDDITQKIQSLLSDEESMRQIQELAAMFSSGDAPAQTEQEQPSEGIGINPMAIMQLIGAMSVQDKNCDLLLALREHLSPEKQQKIDKAVKLMKLYNIFIAMRENGMLDDMEKLL